MNKILQNSEFITEGIFLWIRQNIKILIAVIFCIFLAIASILYFVSQKEQKKQLLVEQYLSAQSFWYQKENVKALEIFQTVYANSSGFIEAMALASIIDLLLEDKQHQKAITLLAEIPTLEQSVDTSLMLVAKAVKVLQEVSTHKIPHSDTLSAKKQLYTFLQNLKVPKRLLSHKHTLLLELNPEITTEPEISNLPKNQLTNIIEAVNGYN